MSQEARLNGEFLVVLGRPLSTTHISQLLEQAPLGLYDVFYHRGSLLGALVVLFTWWMCLFAPTVPLLGSGVALNHLAALTLVYALTCTVASLVWWVRFQRAVSGGAAPRGRARYQLMGWNYVILATVIAPLGLASVPLTFVSDVRWGSLWALVTLALLGFGFWQLPAVLRAATGGTADRPSQLARVAAGGAVLAAVLSATLPDSRLLVGQMLLNLLSVLLIPLLPFMAVATWLFFREARRS